MDDVKTIIANIDKLRADIGSIDKDVLSEKAKLLSLPPFMTSNGPDRNEAVASIVIAHRNLEDGRMRLGKVIQALEGGVSILDHPKVKAVIAEIRGNG